MQVDPSNRTLLLLVTDDHDPEQDGIWKVSTDGRGLEQMLAFKQLDSTYQQRNNLVGYQTFFSNDGRYAIQYKETIIVGSLSSHQKTLFAQPVATEALVNVLGWTRP